jgi:hypothetical protein
LIMCTSWRVGWWWQRSLSSSCCEFINSFGTFCCQLLACCSSFVIVAIFAAKYSLDSTLERVRSKELWWSM